MAQPYVGEIRMFAGNFPPAGWSFCQGQLLPIDDNETLYQLIGTTYGGDGVSTFALPDLRGRLPVHQGNGFNLAQPGGVETVTLTGQQMPVHTHPMVTSNNNANAPAAASAVIGKSTQIDAFINSQPGTQLSGSAIGPAGGNQPHDNMQPYLCVDFIISLFGIFPSPT